MDSTQYMVSLPFSCQRLVFDRTASIVAALLQTVLRFALEPQTSRRESNPGPFDCWADTLPLRHGPSCLLKLVPTCSLLKLFNKFITTIRLSLTSNALGFVEIEAQKIDVD